MTRIIALSGRKQAGKGSAVDYLMANATDLFWPCATLCSMTVPPRQGKFPMAGPLKRFCVDVLGLREEQVYGTDEQKNSPTHLRWEDLPHFPYIERECPRGQMTGRQVQQEVGTGIVRRMWGEAWLHAWVRDVKKSGVEIAYCDDVRYPNEVETIKGLGGVVIRLTRAPFRGRDEHVSERSLDPDVFDQSEFDVVLDNREMTVEETNAGVVKFLQNIGWARNDVIEGESC